MNLKEIDNWPSTWEICHEDIEYGKKIIKVMKPFIVALSETHSSRTVKRHADNLWVLGGYAIERINRDENDRHSEPCFLLATFIDSLEGPIIHDLSEEEQRSFDSTCRKFYKYLMENVEKLFQNQIIHRPQAGGCFLASEVKKRSKYGEMFIMQFSQREKDVPGKWSRNMHSVLW